MLLVMLGVLAGCAARPGPDVLDQTATVAGAKVVTVYVATTRQREAPGRNVFTNGRADALNYAEFKISIPPSHKPGAIEWSDGRPDPATDFVTVEQKVLDRAAFQEAIRSAEARSRRPSAGVFVHGFNYNFQESLFRLAQMAGDADIDGVPILFAWPSDASLSGYVADKEAVTFSRDGLSDLLTMLAGEKSVGEITLLGHSMGAWLTVESLRQLRLTGRDGVIARLNVILASPDIDVDVFRSQMAVVGPLSPPLTVLVARDDVALAVSSRLAGARQRVGLLDVDDPRVLAVALREKIQIIDISSLSASDRLKHDRYVSLATLYPNLEAARSGGGDLRNAGAFVFNTVGATISSPFSLVGRALAGE